jgi:nicotinamidase-related amidase
MDANVFRKKYFRSATVAEPARLERDQTQLLVIDLQEKLLPHIGGHEGVTAQTIRIIRAARELGLPTLLTEQYPHGLGRTPAAVLDAAQAAPLLEKMAFSVWREACCEAHLRKIGRPTVMLVGIEAHVCVQQTALDLLAAGFQPFVLADAVGSRRGEDRETALARMRSAGIVITSVEAAIFEMLDRSGTELFKRLLPIVR